MCPYKNFLRVSVFLTQVIVQDCAIGSYAHGIPFRKLSSLLHKIEFSRARKIDGLLYYDLHITNKLQSQNFTRSHQYNFHNYCLSWKWFSLNIYIKIKLVHTQMFLIGIFIIFNAHGNITLFSKLHASYVSRAAYRTSPSADIHKYRAHF